MPVVNEKITILEELLRRLVPAGEVVAVELKLYPPNVVHLIEHVAVCGACDGDKGDCRTVVVDYEIFFAARSGHLVIGVLKGSFRSFHDFTITTRGKELISQRR